MTRRTLVALTLALLMSGAPALAADLGGSVKAAVERELAQSRPAARGDNPNKVAAIALVGGGTLLMISAFVFQSGIECKDTSTLTSTSVECGEKANKGLLFIGLGAMAAGGVVYMMGERQRSSPQVLISGGRVTFRQQIAW